MLMHADNFKWMKSYSSLIFISWFHSQFVLKVKIALPPCYAIWLYLLQKYTKFPFIFAT